MIASRETAADPHALKALIQDSKATFLQATPATWRSLLEVEMSLDQSRPFKALVGGESVPRDLINKLLNHPIDTVWNMYGPTEATIWSTCHPHRSENGPVSIGRPIANTQIYVLDSLLQPVPVGVVGELCIAGTGLAQGYLHSPELTAERFINNPYFNPFSPELAPKLYKTGDLARYLPDGTLQYISRNDHQIKLRGYPNRTRRN